MTGGTYTLCLDLPHAVDVEVGALGAHRLPAGGYAYTGSALGSGGFTRVDRHRRVATGENDTRHWHVDYLTGHPATELVTVITSGGVDAECRIARRLPDGPVPEFGASDCDCRSHLAMTDRITTLIDAAESAHAAEN
ncbi:GIY-YIG nuclease family protein [Haloplanus sp.]|uniref:GIY-YIG nuclease family protein n=1 Tax=Haloplanus sp. TaxID=1961696 RepID=UPI00262AC097|nr:GIY-YIG nuclease family protein [Haloplanus sp.]